MAKRSQILEELRQTRPLRSIQEEALLGLLKAADQLRRRGGRVVEPFGISNQQYNVLRILRGAGEEGLPTLEIADRLIEQAPGITRLLDRLEKKRLIRRRRRSEDRRQVLCWITAGGLELLARLDAPVERYGREALNMLSEKELRALVGLLDRVRKPA
jgi:MarR family transcriptional regulator, organic hydroperoxide resistance regulator